MVAPTHWMRKGSASAQESGSKRHRNPIVTCAMTEKLFPERLRCKTCRKGLDRIVLDGLYCSYRCASLPTPSADISLAPRNCKREVNGVWDWKTKFRSEGEVPKRWRDDPATNIYRCDYCHFLHIGHSRVQPADTEKLRRTVSDLVTLGSVIQRSREQKNISKKDLARILKVPAIRLTEIEEGSPKANPVIMFAVLNKLRITVELIER